MERSIPRLAERLQFATVLRPLGETTRRELAAASVRKRLKTHEILWRSGSRPAQLAFLLSGELIVERVTADGQRHVFRRYKPNSTVGISTIAGAPHSADVCASEDSDVLLIPGQLLLSDAVFVRAAFGELAKIIGLLSDDYQALLYSSIEGRLVRFIQQAHLDGRTEIQKSQQDLAEEIGASRANVARALGRLKRRGIVRVTRGRLLIIKSPSEPQ